MEGHSASVSSATIGCRRRRGVVWRGEIFENGRSGIGRLYMLPDLPAVGYWEVAVVLFSRCSLILLYSALLLTSLSKAWGKGPVPGNFTAQWFRLSLLGAVDAQLVREVRR